MAEGLLGVQEAGDSIPAGTTNEHGNTPPSSTSYVGRGRRLKVQGHPQLCSEQEASLVYMRPNLKSKQQPDSGVYL